LTSNQVASGLAVVGAAFALLNDLVDPKTLGPHVARVQAAFRQHLASGGPAGLLLIVLGGIAVLAALGLLISVAGSVLLFYGFELSVAGEDLYRSYGLLTRHASSLPRRRIQLVRVEEGLLRRLLRLATLRANTAGSAPTRGEDEQGDDVLLPVLRREQVADLLPVIFPDAVRHDEPAWKRVSRRAIWRGTFRGSVIVLGMTIGVVMLKGLGGLLLLGLIAFVYGVHVVGYRTLGYARDPGFFRTRRGWLSRLTHVVPIRNVQAVVVRQNPLDRRYGVATIQVDTAGQGAASGPHVANLSWDQAMALAADLAHEASATRYRW
jgi:putative membrane protein